MGKFKERCNDMVIYRGKGAAVWFSTTTAGTAQLLYRQQTIQIEANKIPLLHSSHVQFPDVNMVPEAMH